MSTYIQYPAASSGGGGGITSYANLAAFPASGTAGDVGIALDTGIMYEWFGAAWSPIASPSSALSLGTFDAQAVAAKGATLTGGVLYMQSADATHPGLVNISTQSFAGNKTFTGTISASNLSGTNTGDLTLAAIGSSANANGATLTGQVLNLEPASASFGGIITTGTQTIAGAKTLSGDLVLGGNITLTPTVNNSLSGANERIPSHTTANIVFTNAGLTSIGSANNGGVTGGHLLYITNATGAAITIVNNYVSAAVGEAIVTGSGADVLVPNKGTFALQYNATSSTWSFIGSGYNSSLYTTAVSNSASYYPLFVASSSNSVQAVNLGTGLSFNPSTNVLTATTFSGNATTSTTATNVSTVAVSNSANYFPLFAAASADGSQAPNLSASLIYNPSTGALGTLNTTAAASKALLLSSGSPATSGVSGNVSLGSGNALSSSASGTLALSTGTTVNTTSGAITILSGNSSGSGSGAVSIKSGTAEANSAVGNITISAQLTGVSQTGGLIDINTGSRDTAAISLHTNNVNGSGWVNIYSGNGTTAGSGRVTINTGTTTTGTGGMLQLYTGSSSGSATTGKVSLYTGDNSSAATGLVEIYSGAAQTNSGAASFKTGNSTAGNSGDITIQTGTAAGGTRGTITANAPSVYISGVLTPWAASTAYVVNQEVLASQQRYVCQVAHTSGSTLAADIALGKWAPLGGVQSQTPNIMLAGNNFEDNSVGGWVATGCATITNGLPVSVGSGGAVFSTSNGGRAKGANTTAAAVTSSSPIDGIYSLNLATSGAGTIGDGYISQSIPISTAYQAKVLVAGCKFKVASGTPVMGGTSSDTYAIAVYDVTNNAWLGVNGAFSFTQSSGVGDCRATFQTASTTAAIQIFIYSPVAPTGASSLLLDNFVVQQQPVAYGSPVTDWVAYTPTGTWSANTTFTGKYRRVGDSLEIQAQAHLSGAPTGTFTISIPSGLTIDTAKLTTDSVNTYSNLGYGAVLSAGNAGTGVTIGYSSTTALTAWVQTDSSAANHQLSAVNATVPRTFASGDFVVVNAKVPIVGWSSSVVMSSDASTRVVAARYYTTNAQSIASGASAVITTMTKVFDTHAGMNATTGVYTVPVTGTYMISASTASTNTTWTYGGNRRVQLALAGTKTSAYFATANVWASADHFLTLTGCITETFNAGDTISMNLINNAGSNYVLSAASQDNWISIELISGPAQIAASETVAAYYNGQPTGTLTNAFNTTTFPTKVKDSHNAYSGGTYTVPASGVYAISATTTHLATYVLGKFSQIGIYVNGTQKAYQFVETGGANTQTMPTITVQALPLLAGDLVTIKSYDNATSPTFDTTVAGSSFSIVRTGNY